MIAELGLAALWLSFALAVLQMVSGGLGLTKGALARDMPVLGIFAGDDFIVPPKKAYRFAAAMEELKKDLKEIETQAFRFASAFLMPSTTYPYEVKNPSLASLLSLKERWRVAVKAQIVRLAQLKLIPDDYKTTMYKLYSAKRWTRGEPLDDNWPLAAPQLLQSGLNLIVESGVRTKGDLLNVEFTMRAGDIENIASLPVGWFSKSGEVVALKLKESGSGGEHSAEVIPFGRQ